MKLPFFNRQNYIVLKCYTPLEILDKHKTLELSSKNMEVKRNESSLDIMSNKTTFKGCYGMLHSLSRSVTIKSCQEFKVECNGTDVKYDAPSEIMGYDVDSHMRDSYFDAGDSVITKILMPWQVTEKTGAKFVYSRHIQNTTFMNIPTGILSFNNGYSVNVFNYIPKMNIKYKIDFLQPLTSLHLLEDKKLIVETYVDANKYSELCNVAKSSRVYFKNNQVKLEKIEKLNKESKCLGR